MTVAVVAVAVHVAAVVVAVTLVVAAAWLVTVCACCCPQATPSAPPCVPLATAKVFKKVGKNLRLPRLSSLRFWAQAGPGWPGAWHTLTLLLCHGPKKVGRGKGGGEGISQKELCNTTTMSSIATCDWTLVCLSGNPMPVQGGQGG